MNTPALDARLVERYDRPGPRYTSYPTAAQFDGSFSGSDYLAAVQRSRDAGAPLSLYLHMPFCASPCFYCGCTRLISRSADIAAGYLRRLEREIEIQGALFKGRSPIRQLHFGGGTPNYFSPKQLAEVMQSLQNSFGLSTSEDREFSIEVDPRSLAPEAVGSLADIGLNRISIGVQDFDPIVQSAVNRLQTFEMTESLVQAARASGFGSISMDLIYGLPRQSLEGFGRTLDQVIDLAPDRISAYSYAHMSHLFRAQNQIHTADLPTASLKLKLLQLTVSRLRQAGYVYVGMDHFARPDDELARALAEDTLQRNFQGYSTQGGADLIGLGMSAISRIADTYSQNAKTLDGYYSALDRGRLPLQRGLLLSTDDRLRRAVIEAIMCRERVDYAVIEKTFGIEFSHYFADALRALQPLAVDGLVRLESDSLTVTSQGRFLLRAVAMPFDAYLKDVSAESHMQPRYSKVV